MPPKGRHINPAAKTDNADNLLVNKSVEGKNFAPIIGAKKINKPKSSHSNVLPRLVINICFIFIPSCCQLKIRKSRHCKPEFAMTTLFYMDEKMLASRFGYFLYNLNE
jgi:hypothetical protein